MKIRNLFRWNNAVSTVDIEFWGSFSIVFLLIITMVLVLKLALNNKMHEISLMKLQSQNIEMCCKIKSLENNIEFIVQELPENLIQNLVKRLPYSAKDPNL